MLLEKADILIYGCSILPMNGKSFIQNGSLAIKDDKIIFVGKHPSANNIRAENEIDAKEKLAMPGLINCHTHVPMTLFRGLAEDQPLETWLKNTIWPLEAKLKPEDVYVGALLGCLEMIKSGTTCFADMYFHENMVAKAVEKCGMRGVLAEGIIEAGNTMLGKKMLKESTSFAKSFNGYANGRVTTLLGPHAAYTCSPELLIRINNESSKLDVGVHIHLAESKEMFSEIEKRCRSSEVEFLDKIDFFKGHVLAAHCMNLSGKDMQILSRNGVDVTYVPVANMKLGLGATRVKDLTDLGVNVVLGTDGPASNNTFDMFETMKIATLLQKLVYLSPNVLTVYEVLRMATVNGAKALGLGKSIGSLDVGKKADIILIDLSKPHLKPLHDFCANIVYSTRGNDVDTVIVDGKILMQNRQVKTLDEQTIIAKAEETAFRLISR